MHQPLRLLQSLMLSAVGLLLVASGSLAAGSTAPGFYLRWEQCYSDGGSSNQSFACDTNTGISTLVLSFELSSVMPDVSGLEFGFDVATPESTLPAWWQFKNTGTCRTFSLSMLPEAPAGSVNCSEWSGGQASGGFGSYAPVFGLPTPDRWRALFAVAVPPTALQSLAAGQEYAVCLFRINHQKTVGTNACTGCDQPACIHAELVKLTTPVAANDRFMTAEADGPGSGRVTWQGGAFTNVVYNCGQLGCRTDFSCSTVTPTRTSTWSAVKSLYR